MIFGHLTERSTSRPNRQKILSGIHHSNFHPMEFQENNNTINKYIHSELQFITLPLFYTQSTVPPQNQLKSQQEVYEYRDAKNKCNFLLISSYFYFCV